MLPSSPLGFCIVKVCVIVSSFTIASNSFTSLSFQERPRDFGGERAAILKYTQENRKPIWIKAQIWPVKVSTLLVLSKSCRFFRHPYHFHPCSDYLAEGPSTGKNFGSVRMKFGTDRLFTLQILSEPNPFFWDPCHFHPSHAKNFL